MILVGKHTFVPNEVEKGAFETVDPRASRASAAFPSLLPQPKKPWKGPNSSIFDMYNSSVSEADSESLTATTHMVTRGVWVSKNAYKRYIFHAGALYLTLEVPRESNVPNIQFECAIFVHQKNVWNF